MQDLQEQKLLLEIDKLTTEINKNSVVWYRNSDFWKSVLPPIVTTSAVLASLYFTVGKSVIDDEKRKLELQKEQLKLEVMQFANEKKDIQKDIAASTIDRTKLNNQINDLRLQKTSLGKNLVTLQKQTGSLRNENSKLNASIKQERSNFQKDKSLYLRELEQTYKLEKAHLTELSNLNNEIYKRDVTIAALEAHYKYLNSKIKLTPSQQLEIEIEKDKARAAVHNKRSNDIKERRKELEEQYQKNNKRTEEMTSEELSHWYELYHLGKNY